MDIFVENGKVKLSSSSQPGSTLKWLGYPGDRPAIREWSWGKK